MNLNKTLPDGKYFKQPANRVHKDKSKYTRKKKHKKSEDDMKINTQNLLGEAMKDKFDQKVIQAYNVARRKSYRR